MATCLTSTTCTSSGSGTIFKKVMPIAEVPEVLVVHIVEVGHVAVGGLLIVVIVPVVNDNIFPKY